MVKIIKETRNSTESFFGGAGAVIPFRFKDDKPTASDKKEDHQEKTDDASYKESAKPKDTGGSQ